MTAAATLALAVVLAGSAAPFGGAAHRRTEEANEEYRAQRYGEALRLYTEAQVARPEAPELFYDIGNVLYRQGDYEGAEASWRQAMALAGPRLQADIAHNIGNARYRRQEYQEAADAFRTSLELRPDDQETKRNLELALQRLQAQQQQQQQEQQQQEQESQDRQNEEPGNDPQAGDPREDEQPDPGKQEPQGREKRRGGMTREEAERLLDGVESLEKENLKGDHEEGGAGSATEREKDW